MTKNTGWLETTLKLQIDAFGRDPRELTGAERADWLRMNALAAIKEIGEALDETRWKPWATRVGEVVNRELFITEVVDGMHFLGNLLATVGCTDEEFADRYGMKVQVNYERQAREGGYDDVANRNDQGQAVDDVTPPVPAPEPVAETNDQAPTPEPQGAPDAPEQVPAPGEMSEDNIRQALVENGEVQMDVSGLDSDEAKRRKEVFYKIGRDLDRKVSVKTDRKTGIATCRFVDDKPSESAPAAEALAPAPAPAPEPQMGQLSLVPDETAPAAPPVSPIAAPAPAPQAAPQPPQPTAPAAPAAEPVAAAPVAAAPEQDSTHIDRFGRGWRYGAQGWVRDESLDTAPAPEPAS